MSTFLSTSTPVLGIDLGATNIRIGRIQNETVQRTERASTPAQGSVTEVLDRLRALIETFDLQAIKGIGVGVPSVVDLDTGVVYDVQNIPSWDRVPLKSLLEDEYDLPVHVNNDANCFALGEFHFGKGRDQESMIGLTLGTGFAGGIVLDGQLYPGSNCGAGEFGTMPYKESIFEHYCAGLFFERQGLDGEAVYRRAQAEDPEALALFEELGHHLGNALKSVLHAYDPTFIVLGGSVCHAYPFFQSSMWEVLQTFAYRQALENLTIEISELEHVSLLGAGALVYDARHH